MSGQVFQVWRGVDGNDAEGRLRVLHNRQADLEVVMHQQQALRRIYPNDFSIEISELSLLARQQKLYDEIQDLLSHRAYERLNIALNGQGYQSNSAGIAPLGYFLIRLQKLYTSVAQAIRTGPTLRGPIPNFIGSATEFRLASTYPSSFGMSLYVASNRDLIGQNLATEALDAMFGLLNKSVSDEDPMKISGDFGGRAINHLRYLAAHLVETSADLRVDWTDYSGLHRSWAVDQGKASALVEKVRGITQTSSSESWISGTLVGGSLFKNKFEFLHDARAIHLEGNYTTNVGKFLRNYFGTRCEAYISEINVFNQASQENKKYYTLLDLRPSSLREVG